MTTRQTKHTVATFIFGLILAWQYPLLGQDTLFVHALGESTGDEVKIRWAPEDVLLWQYANRTGYLIERVTIKNQLGTRLTPEQRLASAKKWGPVLPYQAEEWQEMIDTSELAGMGAASLYGEDLAMQALSENPLVQTYQRSQMDQTRFGFGLLAADQDWNVAQAMGLALVDKQVDKGKTYLYTIYPAVPAQSFNVQAANLIVHATPIKSLPPPTGLQADFGDKMVFLEWDANSTQLYTSYWIEKSLDGGDQFVTVNSLPIIPSTQKDSRDLMVFYRDSLLENFQNVVYRIRGKTVFGSLSAPSDTISGYGKPKRFEASIGIHRIEEIEPKSLKIHWDFPKTLNQHLEGFDLYRARKKQGPFSKLNPTPLKAMDRSYTDTSPFSSGYYKVIAKDIYGHQYESYSSLGQLQDVTPPSAPIGLTGTLDKDGTVSLSWTPNPEEDLMGYRVFRSNQKDGFYNQVTSYFTRDTSYTHSVDMSTTTSKIFYKVIALDFRENYSEKSIFCEIKRPDLLPPIAPVMKQARPVEEGIVLSWISSTSPDILEHQIQRRKISDEDWNTIFKWPAVESNREYKDMESKRGQDYHYRVLAIDSTGNESYSKAVKVRQLDKGMRPGIENFQVRQVSDQTGIQLEWSYPPNPSLYQFIIYRGKVGEPLRTLHTLRLEDGTTAKRNSVATFGAYQYQDMRIKDNNTYTYQIIAKHRDGGQSPLSPSRSIQAK
ncbi:MAG: hypothetical protein KTR30_03720 [Saprospiraceae bacterium]|nr:hypothetical protein [Saprospiraceae bacterium]